MKRNRVMIVQAVLEGQLSADHLTEAELEEIRVTTELLAFEKSMEELLSQGKWVIWDHDPMLH
jgi:hypothetical protein